MTRKGGHNGCCDFCKVLCAPCMPCCLKCCFCCFPPTNEYPKIIYTSVIQQEKYSTDGESDAVQQSPVHVPVTKIFQTPKTFQERLSHSQLGDDNELDVVTEQPWDMSKVQKNDDFIFHRGDLDDYDDDDDGEKPEANRLSIRSANDFSAHYDDHIMVDPNRSHDSIGKILRTPELTLDRRRIQSFRSMCRSQSSGCSKETDFFAQLNIKLKQEINIPQSLELPCIHYTLYYSKENTCLTVHIGKAAHLSTTYKVDSSNPFVIAYLLPSKKLAQQSPIIQSTYNPVFNYVFKFCGVAEVAKQVLVIKLYINNINHFIGGVVHQLENVDHFGNSIVREISQFDELSSLRDSYQGDILVTLCFKSETRILEIKILEACNLRKEGTPGIPNPYIKVNLIYQGQRIFKMKTSCSKERRVVNPVINEGCKVLLCTMNTDDIQIDIVVMSYDRFSHNHVIGSISMGEKVSHESGQMHWKEVMQLKDIACSRWHAVLTTAATTPVEKAQSTKSLF